MSRPPQAPFVLQFLFPTSCFGCRSPLGRHQHLGGCLECWSSLEPALNESVPPAGLDRLICAFEHQGFARELVLRAKQSRRRELFPAMARFLSALWRVEGILATAVVSAPSARWRTVRRGFSPANDLARSFSDAEGLPHHNRLRRTSCSRSQKRRKGVDRARIVGQIGWNGEPMGAQGRSVLLIDDVMTTGSTLTACAKACRAAGADRVIGLCFSRRKKFK